MKKIPTSFFTKLSKNEPWESDCVKYANKPSGLKAGSFSIVCPSSEVDVVKLSICPIFYEYLSQFKSEFEITSYSSSKQVQLANIAYPVKAIKMPKMEEISEDCFLFNVLKPVISLSGGLDVAAKVLDACVAFDPKSAHALVSNIFLKEEATGWSSKFKIIWRGNYMLSAVVPLSASVADQAVEYEQHLRTLISSRYTSVFEKSLLKRRILKAFNLYKLMEEIDKQIQLGTTCGKEVRLIAKCLSVSHQLKRDNPLLKLDLHRRNVMRILSGVHKGSLFITDPFFDEKLLTTIRNTSIADILIKSDSD